MRGLNPKKQSALFQSNCRTHFKMYKAGRNWLIAGISILGGLLGGIAGTSTAKAQTTAGRGKQLTPQAVPATQTSGVIPATSQNTASTASDAQRTGTSTSTSVASSTTTISTMRQSQTVHSVATSGTLSDSRIASTEASQEHSAARHSTTTTPVASQTVGSTSSSAPTSVPSAALAAVAQPLALPVTPQSYAFSFETNVPDNQTPGSQASYDGGQKQAQADIDRIVSSFTSTGLDGLLHLGWHLGSVPGVSTDITKAIQKISALIDLYYQHQNFQKSDQYGTPVWINGSLPTTTPKQFQYRDFSLGYADYLRSFAQGISAWAMSIGEKSQDADLADKLIDNGNYDPAHLSGTGLLGSLGTAGSITGDWLQGLLPQGNYVDSVLGYHGTTNVASESIQATAKAINYYISIVAPIVINGIAHQALSDIRSIGGHVQDSDYAPATLAQAVQLNGNLTFVLKAIGLSDVLSTTIVQKVYEGIRTNAQEAIERNWTIGAQKALAEFSAGTMATDSTAAYKDLAGYSQTNPADILDKVKGQPLSVVAQAAGYAWYEKVLSAVLVEASNDARLNQPKADITAMVTALQGTDTADKASQTVLSEAQIAQILQPNGEVAHSFVTSDSVDKPAVDNYTRNSVGVKAVIEQLYRAQYAAIRAAVVDYQQHPDATLAQIQAKQQQFIYRSPADTNTMVMNDYQRTYQLLQSTDASYQGRLLADQQLKQLTSVPEGLSEQDLNAAADKFKDGWGFSLGLLEVQPGYTFTNVNSDWLKPAYLQAYHAEFARITTAFQAGQALAAQRYHAAADGLVPTVQAAGSYQNLSATNDGVSVLYPSVTGPSESYAGQAFSKGYQQSLAPITVRVTAGTADQTAFKQTSMATGNQTVYTLVGQAATVMAPHPIPGWVVDQEQQRVVGRTTPTTLTFTYHRAITLQQTTLSDQPTEDYDGRLASAHLHQVTFTPSWTDQFKGQAIQLDSKWLTVAHDAARVGHYQYHLTQEGAQQVLDRLQQQAPGVQHVLPSLATLMALTGQLKLDQAHDAAHLPQLVTRPVTVVAGQQPTVTQLVVAATAANGQALGPTNVTLAPIDWHQLGTHSVTLTLADPLSNQQVTAAAVVTIISQESSTSAWSSQVSESQSFSELTSAENSASEALLSASGQLKQLASAQQSLQDWSQTVAKSQADLTTPETSLTSRLTADTSALDSRNLIIDSQLVSAQESAVSDVLNSLTAASTVKSADVSLASQRVASLSQWSLSLDQHQSQLGSQSQSAKAAATQLSQSLSASQSAVQSEQLSQHQQQAAADSRLGSQLVAGASLSQSLSQQVDQTSRQLASLMTQSRPDADAQHSLSAQLSSQEQQQIQASLAQGAVTMASRSAVWSSVHAQQVSLQRQTSLWAEASLQTARRSLADLDALTSVDQAETSLSQLLSADRSLSLSISGQASLSQLEQSVLSLHQVMSGLNHQAQAWASTVSGLASASLADEWGQAQNSLTRQSQSQMSQQLSLNQSQGSWASLSLAAASTFDTAATSLLQKSLTDHPDLPVGQQDALTSQMASLSQAATERVNHWKKQQVTMTQTSQLAQQQQHSLTDLVAQSQTSLEQVATAVRQRSQILDQQRASQLNQVHRASQHLWQAQQAAQQEWAAGQQVTPTTSQEAARLTSATASLSVQSVSLASQSAQLDQTQISFAQASLAAESAWAKSAASLGSLRQASVSDWSTRVQAELSEMAVVQRHQQALSQALTTVQQRLSGTSTSVAAWLSELTSASVASVSQVAASQSKVAQQVGRTSQVLSQHWQSLEEISQTAVAQQQANHGHWQLQGAQQASLATQQTSELQISAAQRSAQWSVIHVSLSARSALEVAQNSQVTAALTTPSTVAQGAAVASLMHQSQLDDSEAQRLQSLATSQVRADAASTSISRAIVQQHQRQQAALQQALTSVAQQQQATVTHQGSLLTVIDQLTQSERSLALVDVAVSSALTSTQAALKAGQPTSAQATAVTSAATSLSLNSLSQTSWRLATAQTVASLTRLVQAGQSQILGRQSAVTSQLEVSASDQSLEAAAQVVALQSLLKAEAHQQRGITSTSTQVKTAVTSLSLLNQALTSQSVASVSQVTASQKRQWQAVQSVKASLMDRQSQELSAQRPIWQQSLVDHHQWGPITSALTSAADRTTELLSRAQSQLTAQSAAVMTSLSAQSQFTQSQASQLATVQQSLAQHPMVSGVQASALASAEASLSCQRLTDAQAASQAEDQVTSLATTLASAETQRQEALSHDHILATSLQQVATDVISGSLATTYAAEAQHSEDALAAQRVRSVAASLEIQTGRLAEVRASLLVQAPLTMAQSLALTSATTQLSLASLSETSLSLAVDQAQGSRARIRVQATSSQHRAQTSLVSLVEASASAAAAGWQHQSGVQRSLQDRLTAGQASLASLAQTMSLTSQSLSTVGRQLVSELTSLAVTSQLKSQLTGLSTAEQSLDQQATWASQAQSLLAQQQSHLASQHRQLDSLLTAQSVASVSALASQQSQAAHWASEAANQSQHAAWASTATSLSQQVSLAKSQWRQHLTQSVSDRSVSLASLTAANQAATSRNQQQTALISQSQEQVTALHSAQHLVQTTQKSLSQQLSGLDSLLNRASTASTSLEQHHQTPQQPTTSLLNSLVQRESQGRRQSEALAETAHSLAQLSASEIQQSVSVQLQQVASQQTSLSLERHQNQRQSQLLVSLAQADSGAAQSLSVTSQQIQSAVTSQSLARQQQVERPQLPLDLPGLVAGSRPTALHRHQSGDQVKFRRFRVTGVKKLGFYLSPNFSRRTRLAWYVRRARTQQPQFMVIGRAVSRHGILRYKVRDLNRQSPTYGLVGYITARSNFVHRTYYRALAHAAVMTVINVRGINGYRLINLKHKLAHYRPGQVLRVRRIQHFGTTWRYQLVTGQYVTANKQWVSRGRITSRHLLVGQLVHPKNGVHHDRLIVKGHFVRTAKPSLAGPIVGRLPVSVQWWLRR